MTCPTCNDSGVIPISGPDRFGMYDTDDCPTCVLSPSLLDRPRDDTAAGSRQSQQEEDLSAAPSSQPSSPPPSTPAPIPHQPQRTP